MLPLRDDNPTRSFPLVTVILLLVNVGVFIAQLGVGLSVSAIAFGMIPNEIVHAADTVYRGERLGLPPGAGIRNLDPAWLTLLSSMFMHGSWMHILSNMWFLWIFGNNVEDELGGMRFLLFYLLSGLGAAGAQILVGTASMVPMVGASGALAGVMGAYLVLYPGSRITCLVTMIVITTVELPAALVLGFWFLLQVVNGLLDLGPRAFGGGVAHAAHVGGFIGGWLLIRVFSRPRRFPTYREYQRPDFIDP
jgi:membrane associated rhomboid family serine protease